MAEHHYMECDGCKKRAPVGNLPALWYEIEVGLHQKLVPQEVPRSDGYTRINLTRHFCETCGAKLVLPLVQKPTVAPGDP